MKNTIEFLSRDVLPIQVDLNRLTVKAVRKNANRNSSAYFDLSGHPLSGRMCEFLILRGPSEPACTVFTFCTVFLSLLEYFKESSYKTLNRESFGAYAVWLRIAQTPKKPIRYGEATRRVYGNLTIRFMDWLSEVGESGENDVIDSRLRHQRMFKGFNARRLELMRLTAVAPDDFVRLMRAVRLEYEECKGVQELHPAEQDKYKVCFPLLPFSMLLGLQLAVRSVEFNYLKVGDLRGDRLLLNPPNKRPSEVWLPPSLMAALDLAKKGMLRYRPNPTPDEPLLVCQIKQGARSNQIVRFNTVLLRVSLLRFFSKYFERTDADGFPSLYATDSEETTSPAPFQLSFSHFRTAAITEAARHERNPTAIMRFARHAHFTTTWQYYIRETHRQWVSNIGAFLAPSAERLRMSLENKVATLVEENASQGANASVPGGHCEQAVTGAQSCRRSSDCRLCAFFRIHTSKREFFIREREEALKQAEAVQSEQGLLRDAQNLREFAALNEAIINRIDDYLADQDTQSTNG